MSSQCGESSALCGSRRTSGALRGRRGLGARLLVHVPDVHVVCPQTLAYLYMRRSAELQRVAIAEEHAINTDAIHRDAIQRPHILQLVPARDYMQTRMSPGHNLLPIRVSETQFDIDRTAD